VLKPGGMLIASSEPSAPLLIRERDIQDQLDEWHAGIVERRPKVFQYVWSLWRAGFRQIRVDTLDTYQVKPDLLSEWIKLRAMEWHKVARPINKPLIRIASTLVRRLPASLAGQAVIN